VADDRITVVFGAQVAELIAGVAEAKEAIEGLRAPVDGFLGSLSGIAEAIGAAFAIEKRYPSLPGKWPSSANRQLIPLRRSGPASRITRSGRRRCNSPANGNIANVDDNDVGDLLASGVAAFRSGPPEPRERAGRGPTGPIGP
jgi:hypothetical protein